jgi:23S rRNA (adenine2503-C2)-methyltransferase
MAVSFDLRSALPEEIETWLTGQGEPRYRAAQVFRGLHALGREPADLTNVGRALRVRLAETAGGALGAVTRVERSEDGTVKLLVTYADGAAVETVLLPTHTAGRLSQCVSTQVGCAMGCVFCHSGVAGLKRNLTAAEIVAQLHLGRPEAPAGRLGGVVLMGMGEPLHNYDAVARAIRLMIHPDGLGISPRRITLSTVGLVPELARLGKEFGGQLGLAVSLHAGDDETRGKLLPVNRKYDLAAVIEAIRAYPVAARRRITIEYTLIAGVNDDLAQARKLAALLAELPVKVNLIPMNAHDGSEHQPPSAARCFAFQEELAAAGLSVFTRKRRGADIAAACGQLALRGVKARRGALPVLG